MRNRIRCLWHEEETPSLVQYKNGWRCFGACQRPYTNKEVEERAGQTYEYHEEEENRDDLTEDVGAIAQLPRQRIRGLDFPADNRGYFIVWPDLTYYKYRPYEPGTGPKYIGPRGHRPPLFWARRTKAKILSVVEGEINALSVALAYPEWDVCSPGSASMFNADNLSKYLTVFKEYSNLVVVLDKDAAGLKALIEAKAFFLYKIPFISYVMMRPDSNDVLIEKGPEGLRGELQRADRR